MSQTETQCYRSSDSSQKDHAPNRNGRNRLIKLQAHRILILITVGVSAFSGLSACTLRSDSAYSTKISELETAPAAEAVSGGSEMPDLGETESPPAELVEHLKAVVAAETGAPSAEILVRETTPTEWNDACLGAPKPDEICAQVITPGYRVVLSSPTELGTPTESYLFHTDQTGENFRQVSGIPVEKIEAQSNDSK